MKPNEPTVPDDVNDETTMKPAEPEETAGTNTDTGEASMEGLEEASPDTASTDPTPESDSSVDPAERPEPIEAPVETGSSEDTTADAPAEVESSSEVAPEEPSVDAETPIADTSSESNAVETSGTTEAADETPDVPDAVPEEPAESETTTSAETVEPAETPLAVDEATAATVVPEAPVMPAEPTAPAVDAIPPSDAVPVVSPVVVSSTPAVAPSVTSGGPGGKKKRRNLFIIAVVALVVILGGGYTFAFYLPNTPGNVYKNGLSNTAKAYDKLVAYGSNTISANYKGVKASGTLQVNVGGITGDGSFDFKNQGGNGSGSLNIDVAGEKLAANIRSVEPSGQTDPDLYVQLTGIKPILAQYGLTDLSNLDGQWVGIDHELLKSVTNTLTSGTDTSAATPTPAQIKDAMVKVGAVDKQYIFAPDASHAVLKNEKYLGKSTQNGRSVYGYQTGYDKAHLQAYVGALGTALDSSSLNTWSKAANQGKSLSAVLNFGSLKQSVASSSGNYNFIMYIDAKTKLVGKLHFADATSNSYVEVGQTYNGGSVYPFELKVASGDGTKDSQALTANMSVNSVTNEVNLSVDFSGNSGGTATKVGMTAKLVPSNDTVTVTAPTGATSLNNVLGKLGLGAGSTSDSLLGSGATDQSLLDSSSSNLFTLTQ